MDAFVQLETAQPGYLRGRSRVLLEAFGLIDNKNWQLMENMACQTH
jgi:hypothetical protein